MLKCFSLVYYLQLNIEYYIIFAAITQNLIGSKFMTEEVRASHILVKTENEANELLSRINSGENFENLAQEVSMCPSGRSGGDLGFFPKGVMVKEFEDAAFSLEKGQISQPVQTQFGWHLIKLVDKH